MKVQCKITLPDGAPLAESEAEVALPEPYKDLDTLLLEVHAELGADDMDAWVKANLTASAS